MAACLHITNPLVMTLIAAKVLFQLKPKHEALCQSFVLAWLQDPTITDAQQVAISQRTSLKCLLTDLGSERYSSLHKYQSGEDYRATRHPSGLRLQSH